MLGKNEIMKYMDVVAFTKTVSDIVVNTLN